MQLLWFLILQTLLSVGGFPHPSQRKRQADGYLGALSGNTNTSATYDYVVVGAGTGGLAIANRLAADGKTTVAVIEAGTLYEAADALASTPAGDTIGVGWKEDIPTVDWNFWTEPQAGAGGRVMSYARGKCLGGTSARNFMVYQRPTVESLDKWVDAVGDDSYSWDNVLPYYKKSPELTPPNTAKRAANASASYNTDAFSATGGPLEVSYPNFAQPFSSYMAGGLNEIGIDNITDFNSGKLIGTQYCSSTISPSTETRESSQTSFLDESIANENTNLQVYTLTMARQILFDSNNTATGVLVSTAEIPYTLYASKEVIVSAGAFNSPQLLMLSGIGPQATLEQFNISVRKDAPGVGQGMWDHVSFGPAYRVDVQTLTRLANDLVYTAAEFATDYTLLQSGPLTNPTADYLGWEKIPDSLRSDFGEGALNDLSWFPSDWPEVEYISGAGYVGDWSSLFTEQPKDGYQYATILAATIAPLSRGNVTIQSADVDILPLINPGYLTSTTDQKVAVAAYKRIRQAFNSSYMQQAVIGEEYYPGPSVQTDEEILETIQNSLQTLWHASCTNKMGNSSDPMAVVDSHARVFGVNGVRVVDSSAFPILVPGHPQSTVYMLAEKIADLILNGD